MAPKAFLEDERYNVRDYRQSFTMKLYEANVMVSLNHKGKVEILKSRYGSNEVTTENLIDALTEILVKHIFNGGMDMFQESMKNELKKAIYKTLKGGVAECESRSENELLKWVSNLFQKKDCSDILIDLGK
ncbi:MAG: hypothetical protein ACFFG0_01990 [Candidatus Thorarchaeota archaeon]